MRDQSGKALYAFERGRRGADRAGRRRRGTRGHDTRPGAENRPGDSLRCEILLDPRTQDYGIVTEHLVVVTNDPVRPMRRIRVTAIIEE